VAPSPDLSPARRSAETGRLVVGALLELGIKAYGAAAAVSVALSAEETVTGKAGDAVGAVRNLEDRYEAAVFVARHREEVQSALEALQDAPPEAELRGAVERSSETLRDIETTSTAVGAARDALGDLSLGKALGHLRDAVDARPDTESLRDLAAFAEQVGPVVDEADVLIRLYYAGLAQAVDNFSGDEIAGTLGVMATALGLAFVLGHAVGFWARRGRPGLLARALQGWGATVFRRWYVRDPQRALGEPLYAAARERLQRDIAADPQQALDPEVFRDLEAWFASRWRPGP
jgi:hypothetical protein